ncbi:hypothetical protein XENOCAPTIV_002772, partial [Xenoophorus captivus]
ELTGQLPKDYPLLPGEKPPQIRRRIGAAFKLDEQNIPQGSGMKIYEAARKLCEENHLSKAVRRSRILQCKTQEKKLKKLQEMAFQLRLECGRSSPLPSFNVTQQGLLYLGETDPPQPLTMTTHSSIDGSYVSSSVAPQSPLSNPCQSPCPSFDSKLSFNSNPAYDPPPIQHSPWSESSLDQPYQKSKKSRSSSTMR